MCPYGDLKQVIYEFTGSTLKNRTDPVYPERFKQNPSPAAHVPNFIQASGDISMHFHCENMLPLFRHAFMDDSIASVDFTPVEIYSDSPGAGPIDPTDPSAASASPGRLDFDFENAYTGNVTITGTEQNDHAASEVLAFSAEQQKSSVKYYKTVTSVAFSVSVVGTLAIDSDKNTYTHTITLKDNILNGLTMEMVKGESPNRYLGCLVNSFTLELADIIGLTFGVQGKRGNNRMSVESGDETPTVISGYSRMNENVYPGWGFVLSLDETEDGGYTTLPVASGSLAFANTMDYPVRYRNERTYPKPIRQAYRVITLDVGADYDTVANGGVDFDDIIEAQRTMDAYFMGYRKPYAGPEYSFRFNLPRVEIMQFPDPELASLAEVVQTLGLRTIRSSGATASDEIELVIVSTESAE